VDAVGPKLKTTEVIIIIMKTKSNVLITALAVLALATGCTTTGKKSDELNTNVKDARADFLNSDNTRDRSLPMPAATPFSPMSARERHSSGLRPAGANSSKRATPILWAMSR
jgi:hypothetical protein